MSMFISQSDAARQSHQVIPIGVLTEYVALIAYYGSSHRDTRCGAKLHTVCEGRTDAPQAETNGPVANLFRYGLSFMDIWNTVVFMVLCFFSWTGRYGIERYAFCDESKSSMAPLRFVKNE